MMIRTQIFLNKIRQKLDNFFVFFQRIFTPKNKKIFIVLFFVVLIGSFAIGGYVFAAGVLNDIGNFIGKAFSYLLYYICYALGWITMKIFGLLVVISTYNDFVTSKAVNKGWVLIRDMANMVIVILLLIYAFATILRIQKYSERRFLPRLLIAAVLVNFSKLIAGVIIDAAQVFMLTFVNGYAATAGANLVNGIGLTKALKVTDSGKTSTFSDWSDLMVVLFFGIVFMIGTLLITVMITSVLLLRIAMLWILIVLSPFGFLGLSQFPRLESFTGMWWDDFFNYVIMGPLLAFFLWLSLLIMSDPGNIDTSGKLNSTAKEAQGNSDPLASPESSIANIDTLATATIALAMLYGSYFMTKKLSATAGAVGGKAMRFTKSMPGRALRGSYKGLRVGYKGASMAGRGAVGLARVAGKTRVGGAVKRGARRGGAAVSGAVGRTVGAVGSGLANIPRVPFRIPKALAKTYQTMRAGGGVMKGMAAGGKELVAPVVGAVQRKRSSAGKRREAKNLAKEQELIKERAEKMTGYDGNAFRSVLADSSISREDRAAALQGLAETGEIKSSDAEAVQDTIASYKHAPGVQKELRKSLQKNNAHMAYDLKSTEGQENFRKDLRKGKINFEEQDESFFENEEAMSIVMDQNPGTRALPEKELRAKLSKAAQKRQSVALSLQKRAKASKNQGEKKILGGVYVDATGDLDGGFESMDDRVDYIKTANTSQLGNVQFDTASNETKQKIAPHILPNRIKGLINTGNYGKADQIGEMMVASHEELKKQGKTAEAAEVMSRMEKIVSNPEVAETGGSFERMRDITEEKAEIAKRQKQGNAEKAERQKQKEEKEAENLAKYHQLANAKRSADRAYKQALVELDAAGNDISRTGPARAKVKEAEASLKAAQAALQQHQSS